MHSILQSFSLRHNRLIRAYLEVDDDDDGGDVDLTLNVIVFIRAFLEVLFAGYDFIYMMHIFGSNR
jgi:hypothetical protein